MKTWEILNVEGISEKFCNVNYSDTTLDWNDIPSSAKLKLNWFEKKNSLMKPTQETFKFLDGGIEI